MNKIISGIFIVIVIAILVFLYITRPPALPSEDIQNAGEILPTTENSSIYRIDKGQSTAEYTINEVLRGSANTVLGTTSEISGDIRITFTPNTEVEIGVITINARTFKTDSERRDGAVNRSILKSEEVGNEFITFKPTNVTSVPEMIELDKEISFQVIGDLTIAGITKPVTLTITGTVEQNRISGEARATIKRSDFNLQIPSVPTVSGVEDDLIMRARIVANKVNPI
jgi:polyisoprenoid-binding protein YceI